MNSQPAPQWLMENLSALAEKAKAVKLESPENLRELLAEFEVWTVEAKGFCGPWVSTLSAQARQWLRGLDAGRPLLQGLERLLQGILEANTQLEKDAVLRAQQAGREKGNQVFLFEAQAVPAQDRTTGTAEPQAAVPAGEAFISHVTVKEDDRDGFKDFLQETPGYLSDIESNLMALSGQGSWDAMKVYRPFHTLKSLFGYLGFPAMGEEAHKAEALLEPYKAGKGRPTEGEREALLKILDLFRRQIGLIADGYLKGRIEVIDLKRPAALAAVEPLSSGKSGEPGGEIREDFIRVDAAKMDGLLEAMEELAICHNQLAEIVRASASDPGVSETVERLGKLTRGLQDRILSVRMVPVEPLFKRLSRLVRDLAVKTEKTVQLRLEGASTELDKRLVDELWEPLVHLVRNAMDHGLEPMAKRLAAGKSAHGTLTVKAQHQGGDFVLEVADDGRGLNATKIAEKAGRLGLLPPSATSGTQWLEDLVFRPGFSTAGKVTEVSGRGVGLDVVKRRIQALKGSIHLESREGFGCRFTIRVPLTLALMEGILLRAGRALYLLPLTQVGRFWNVQTGLMEKGKGQSALEASTGGAAALQPPVRRIDLAEKFNDSHGTLRQPVGIEIGSGDNRAFVLADEILGKKQVVLKGLSGVLEGFPSVNGAALLSDGRVSLVLDVPSLLREAALSGAKS